MSDTLDVVHMFGAEAAAAALSSWATTDLALRQEARMMAAMAGTGGRTDPISSKVFDALKAVVQNEAAVMMPEEMTAPVPQAPVVVSTGQVLASTLVTVSRDFPVTVLDPATIPEQIRPFIPSVDPLYQPDAKALAMLLRGIESNDKILMTGPTGCGKSQLVRHACAITNRPMIRINMTEDAESSVIFGSLTAKDGSTVWVDGPATEAWRYGAVLNVDEYDVTPSGVAMGFQWMLENDGKLFLKEMPGAVTDKILTPHPNARLVMCGNTVGQGDETGAFSGVQPQNSAFVDRFQTTIKLNYMRDTDEVRMLMHALDAHALPAQMLNRMVQLAGLVRQAHDQRTVPVTMSPRTLLNWGSKVNAYGGELPALEVAYLNKLTDSQRKQVDVFIDKIYTR